MGLVIIVLLFYCMAFKLVKGKSRLEWYAKAASTAFTKDCLVQFEGSGAVIPAAETVTDIVGTNLKTVAATDTDYASTTLIPVEIPLSLSEAVFEGDVTTGTLTAALVGTTMDLDTSAGVGVDAGTDTIHQLLCVGYISASKGLFRIADAGTQH